MFQIFVINPGSTSTKVALFQDEQQIFAEKIHHPIEELAGFPTILSQMDFRLKAIEEILSRNGQSIETVDAFVGRGGLLRPIPSGTYLVTEAMIADLKAGVQGEHASNLGGILAYELGRKTNKPAFIVDPVVVDEMEPIARLSGHPKLPRKSIFHALNHKAVARKAAARLGKNFKDANFIVAHLGGGISIAAHQKGKVVDVNNALDGEGPFTPERAGTLPAGDLARLCFSGRYSKEQVAKMIKGEGGIVAYLGTNSMQQVAQKVASGDEQAELVYKAMAYQVAKEISALAAVLKGEIDAIILTGGIAYDQGFCNWIKERCSFLAPIFIFPGEEEMEALALGALRVLRQEEEAKNYEQEAGGVHENF